MQETHSQPGIKVHCWECLFFDKDSAIGYISGIGLCRRHAPKPWAEPFGTPGGIAIWPVVKPADYCGEGATVLNVRIE